MEQEQETDYSLMTYLADFSIGGYQKMDASQRWTYIALDTLSIFINLYLQRFSKYKSSIYMYTLYTY